MKKITCFVFGLPFFALVLICGSLIFSCTSKVEKKQQELASVREKIEFLQERVSYWTPQFEKVEKEFLETDRLERSYQLNARYEGHKKTLSEYETKLSQQTMVANQLEQDLRLMRKK